MGASLTGRGAVQIWCLLNIREHSEEVSYLPGKKEKKPKKDTGTNDKSIEIKRPRGRPRKNPTENNEEISPIKNKRKRGRPKKNPTVIAVDSTNCGTKYISSGSVPNGNNENNEEILCITYKSKKRPKGRPKKNSKDGTVSDPNCENQFVPSRFS
jgi:general transcription factor 3C polypeptide 2